MALHTPVLHDIVSSCLLLSIPPPPTRPGTSRLSSTPPQSRAPTLATSTPSARHTRQCSKLNLRIGYYINIFRNDTSRNSAYPIKFGNLRGNVAKNTPLTNQQGGLTNSQDRFVRVSLRTTGPTLLSLSLLSSVVPCRAPCPGVRGVCVSTSRGLSHRGERCARTEVDNAMHCHRYQ